MKVLFLSSEVAPFAKTGGLGDVSAALPRALHKRGHDVRVFMPLYSRIEQEKYRFRTIDSLRSLKVMFGTKSFEVSILGAQLPGSTMEVFFVHCPQLYGRHAIYAHDGDEHLRFLVLCYAALEAAQRMRERIEEALGRPLNKPKQYQTPQEMLQAGMRQWQHQQEADEARKSAKRAARKAQKDAQKKNTAAEKGDLPPKALSAAVAKSAIRTIFRQLASALHPDRETDEQERLRKTGLMSEVNAAYEKNDLTTLLRLQMQVNQVNPQSVARMAHDQLMAMTVLLKEQVAALEEDLDQLQSRLSRELCVNVLAQAEEAEMTQSLQRLQADQRHVTDSLEADLRRIQNDAALKRWLKEQWQLAKAQVQDTDGF